MKASELRDLDDNELSKRLAELRREVFGLRFSNATGELDNTAGPGHAKRDLARALTVARERELAGRDPARATEEQRRTRTDEMADETRQRHAATPADAPRQLRPSGRRPPSADARARPAAARG